MFIRTQYYLGVLKIDISFQWKLAYEKIIHEEKIHLHFCCQFTISAEVWKKTFQCGRVDRLVDLECEDKVEFYIDENILACLPPASVARYGENILVIQNSMMNECHPFYALFSFMFNICKMLINLPWRKFLRLVQISVFPFFRDLP